MKPLSPSLQAHLAGDLTTLATLVKISRQDGLVKGFTTHDQDITIGGVVYQAAASMTPSAIESRAGLAVDHLEVTGILDSAALDDTDIEAGLYDFARVDVALCNWADVTMGILPLRRGWIGQITRAGAHYVAELRGMHDLLQRPVGDTYTPECRFDLGDASCGVVLTPASGSVTRVTDQATFTDTAQTAASGAFAYGQLTWTSGANTGQKIEVKTWDSIAQTFTLWLPMRAPITVGDTYQVTQGCDKKFTTCRNVFSNGTNFGGFPYVPGVGNILKYPT